MRCAGEGVAHRLPSRGRLAIVLIGMLTMGSASAMAETLSYAKTIELHAARGRVGYFIASKHGPSQSARCEDGLFFNERYLVVVDGATDKSGRSYDGKRSGRVVRDIVLEVFAKLPADLPPMEVVRRLNAHIQRFYARHPRVNFEGEAINRATASLIWYSFARSELSALGDCKARVDGRRFNQRGKLVDDIIAGTRKRVFRRLPRRLSAEERSRIARSFIKPLLAAQFRLQNNARAPMGLGYWVLDGFPVHGRALVVRKLRRPPRVIELSSDGYPDYPQHISVGAYERLLSSSLKRDPYRVGRYASTKGLKKGQVSYDDRALLIWRR